MTTKELYDELNSKVYNLGDLSAREMRLIQSGIQAFHATITRSPQDLETLRKNLLNETHPEFINRDTWISLTEKLVPFLQYESTTIRAARD